MGNAKTQAKGISERALRQALDGALDAAVDRLRSLTAGEHLYAFALYTSGVSDYGYVRASANTEEGLVRRRDECAARDEMFEGQDGLDILRWTPGDWAYHDFSPEVASVELPPRGDAYRDAMVSGTFAKALKRLDREGHFGSGPAREEVALLILCGDMSRPFFENGLRRLNRRGVVDRCLASYDRSIDLFIRRSAEQRGRTAGLREGLEALCDAVGVPREEHREEIADARGPELRQLLAFVRDHHRWPDR